MYNKITFEAVSRIEIGIIKDEFSEVSTSSNLELHLEVADQVAGDWRLTDEMKLECRLTEEWKYQDLKWTIPDEDKGK